jgi:endonuclease YncB( thermonuclease family)
MIRSGVSIFVLIVFSVIAAPSRSLADAEYVGQAVVTDGDTIKIRGTKIRLWGIDAVEGAQKCWDFNYRMHRCGKYAAAALRNFIGHRVVTCNQVDTDRYGRPVAQCFTGGIDLGGWMVTQGYAIDFTTYSKGYYGDAQEGAQAGSRGNWNFDWQHPSNYRSCLRAGGQNSASCSQQ